jgi:uncharacterized protein (TIGR03067 family)
MPVQQPAPAKAATGDGRAGSARSQAKKERDPVQGSWQLVACTENGRDVPGALVKQVRIDFHGATMRMTPPLEFHERQVVGAKEKHVEIKLGQGEFQIAFQLDAASRPKGIDLILPEDPEKRVVAKGIYALEGDRLTICLRAGDRPTDFSSKPGSERARYVLERKKPSAEPSGTQAGRADEKAIQGTWEVVAAQRYGLTWKNVDGGFMMQDQVPLAFPISPGFPNQVVFSGRHSGLEYPQGEGRTLVRKDTFTLDAARKPKWITLTAEDGEPTYGIYSLDRGELRLCWQVGRREDLRSADFKTQAEIDPDDDTEVWVLRRPAPAADKEVAPREGSKAVPIQQSWDGILRNRKLLKASPPEGFVVEARSWAKLWRGWRGQEPVPPIDFQEEMALILTVPGPNQISAPELRLDKAGNLKAPLPVSTLLPDDGRMGYKIIRIKREGVKAINGRSLKPKIEPGQSF